MYEWLHKRLRSISGKGSRLMIKGILKIGIGVTLLLSAATAVQAQDALLLTVRTTDVRIAEDNNTVHLTISLDLEIKNQSQSNVILFWHEVEIVGNLISASADPTRPTLLFQVHPGLQLADHPSGPTCKNNLIRPRQQLL